MELSEVQTTSLMIINIFICLFFLINLVFITHNVFRYIIRLKIFSSLIVSFYVLLTISTSLRIVETGYKILYPSKILPMSKFVEIVMSIALYFMVGVGITLIVTMHQLTMTLQTITITGKPEVAQRRNLFMKIAGICWWFVYGAFELYGNDKPVKIIYLIILVQMLLMILVYIIVIIMLNKHMG